jgi:hypothetical protein
MQMFRRKRRNALQAIIFTDGRIVSTFQDGDLMTVVFRDQAESEFTMRFQGVTKHTQSPHACVYDVMHAKVVEQLSGWSLRLSDDDDEVLLALDFQDVEVSY